MSESEGEYSLVMPFVVCGDGPGQYEDRAFVAGYTAAVLDRTLAALSWLTYRGLTVATVERYVPPALVPQLDLIAMYHGFRLTIEPWDDRPDDWVRAVFTLGSDE